MMNIVVHNLLAVNANRQFGIVNKKKAKSTEKLSSGYKINRAADDAAGLSISEKMRRQIRGLHKAEENIQDGISLCQVADGALNETHDILQRMNELSVKAGNDTNSQTDRAFIQTEIDALTEEIDRIAYQTTFNEEIYPLLGINDVNNVNNIDDIENGGIPDWIHEITLTMQVVGDVPVLANGTTYQVGDYVTITGIYVDGVSGIWTDGTVVGWLSDKACTDWKTVGIDNASHRVGDCCGDWYSNQHFLGNNLSIGDLKIDADGDIYYEGTGGRVANHIAYPQIETIAYSGGNDLYTTALQWYQSLDDKGSIMPDVSFLSTKVSSDNTQSGAMNSYKENVWIHMSTEPGIGMFINLVNATAKGIGIENLDMSSMENAGKAINAIKGALEKVSRYRTVFGAQQNRLEYAMRINANIAEKTTDAESRIRDTDVAEEMVTFSNENILAQAGQSMLSQANQSQQYILNLLS